MSKFEENFLRSMVYAQNVGQAKKIFDATCEACASKNLLACRCESGQCPIERAYLIRIDAFESVKSLYEEAGT